MGSLTVSTVVRAVARFPLGAFLVSAGVAHLTSARIEFQAQVPVWIPLDPDFVVVASGVVEIVLGVLLFAFGRILPWVGPATAPFFIAIFPGNIKQYDEGIDASGLETDSARLARLFLQPASVAWALWSTNGWRLIAARLRREP